jgi:hypothetical protein
LILGTRLAGADTRTRKEWNSAAIMERESAIYVWSNLRKQTWPRTTFPEIQTIFRVHRPDSPRLELTLSEVEDGASTPTQEQFLLFFYGSADSNLGQGTFELEHESLGQLQIFLVPIGIDSRGIRYQAVFNVSTKSRNWIYCVGRLTWPV